MSVKPILLKFCITFIVLFSSIHSEKLKHLMETKWTDNVAKYIQNYSKKTQVMFIIEDEEKDQMVEIKQITKAITQNIPSFITSFDAVNQSRIRYQTLEKNPRASTIFILVLASRNKSLFSRISGPLEFLNYLSKVKSRPKCLILHPLKQRRFTYKKILQDLWKKQFLDVSILEIVNNCSSQSRGIRIPSCEKDSVIFHQFNPFSKVYERQQFSSKSVLFPDKTHNLHTYRLKSLIFNGSLPTKNKFDMVNIISKVLNFSSNFVVANWTQYGKFACRKEEFTGELNNLLNNQLHFAVDPINEHHICEDDQYEPTRIVKLDTMIAVVPRLLNHKLTIISPWDMIFTLIFITFLLIAVEMIPSNCTFQKSVWRPLHMVQLLTGMSVTAEPQKLKDRIIFGSLLITYVIYSSYLFTLFTEVGITTVSELKLQNMDDLNKENLIPFLYSNMYVLMEKVENKHYQKLRVKYQLYSSKYSELDCLTDALRHEKVACAMTDFTLFNLIQKATMKAGGKGKSIKVMKEPLLYTTQLWMLEPGSPFTDQFDKVLLKLMENGVISKLNLFPSRPRDLMKSDVLKRRESIKLLYPLLSLIMTGYLLSMIVFVAEVFFGSVSKRK